jgi:ubiquitin-protein ligase
MERKNCFDQKSLFSSSSAASNANKGRPVHSVEASVQNPDSISLSRNLSAPVSLIPSFFKKQCNLLKSDSPLIPTTPSLGEEIKKLREKNQRKHKKRISDDFELKMLDEGNKEVLVLQERKEEDFAKKREEEIATKTIKNALSVFNDELFRKKPICSEQNNSPLQLKNIEEIDVSIDVEILDPIYQRSTLIDDSENLYKSKLRQHCFAMTFTKEVFHRFTFDKFTIVSPKLRALIMKEIEDLPNSLPCTLNSSIFIIFDAKCITRAKAIFSFPSAFSFTHGLYLFDVFFPSDYPTSPPQFFLITAQDHINFNYLELPAIKNWPHNRIPFSDLLKSIQSYFTTLDNKTYQTPFSLPNPSPISLKLANINFAMFDHLTNPPSGFTELIHQHFFLKSSEIKEYLNSFLYECEYYLSIPTAKITAVIDLLDCLKS